MNTLRLLSVTFVGLIFMTDLPAQNKPTTDQAEPQTQPVGEPLANLPSHVKGEKGKLTLFADFEKKDDKGVPVYFLNRTGKPLVLQHQDQDIYVKLEYESAPGQWTRAQPHQLSGCGNSYFPQLKIADEAFLMRVGHFPEAGTKAKVRYSIYRQSFEIASNVTNGFVVDDEVRMAGNDTFAVVTGNLEFVSKVARGELQLKNEMDHVRNLRMTAIWQLGEPRFPREQTEKVLKSIAASGEQLYAKEATNMLARLENQKQP